MIPIAAGEIENNARRDIDCEQSLFYFRFSKGSARARERRAAKPRDARNEGGACLRRFARRTKKKERLLVV